MHLLWSLQLLLHLRCHQRKGLMQEAPERRQLGKSCIPFQDFFDCFDKGTLIYCSWCIRRWKRKLGQRLKARITQSFVNSFIQARRSNPIFEHCFTLSKGRHVYLRKTWTQTCKCFHARSWWLRKNHSMLIKLPRLGRHEMTTCTCNSKHMFANWGSCRLNLVRVDRTCTFHFIMHTSTFQCIPCEALFANWH